MNRNALVYTLYEQKCSSMYNVCIPMHVCTRVVLTVWIFSVPPHPSKDHLWNEAALQSLKVQHCTISLHNGQGKAAKKSVQVLEATALLPLHSIQKLGYCLFHVISIWSPLEKFFVFCAEIVMPLIILRDMRLRRDRRPPASMSSSQRNPRKPAFAVVY